MIKMSRKAKKAMAVALTAGMLASTAVTPVMAATQGWKQNSKGWWYQNADGSYPANKWEKINGKWYYFNANGYMLANAWAKDSKGLWYYVGADGAMKTNAWAPDKAGLWYWVTEDGSMFEGGWKKINNKWYFFKNDGVMQSGVVTVDGKTYYLGTEKTGAMETGEITIGVSKYTFDAESGACTSEKAPTTNKNFDSKGNPKEQEVEIEKIDGVNAVVVNGMSDYAEYAGEGGGVVMAGTDATIKVLVTENGEPVVGTAVTLKLHREDEGSGTHSALSPVTMTDSNGYAIFVVRDHAGEATGGADDTAIYTYTVTAAASEISKEGKLIYAAIDCGKVAVNPDKKDTLVASENAPTDFKAEKETAGIDGKTTNRYIASQQVSSKGTEDHKVTFEINPQLIIPQGKAETVTDTYQKDINETISEYSVYEDKSFKVEDIPAGLKYATLYLENIDISEHTKVVITTYKSSNDEEIKTQEIEGTKTQSSTQVQIPVQEDSDTYMVIKVVSEGQVDEAHNGGITVKEIKGVYQTQKNIDAVKIPLTDNVTWSQTDIQYDVEETLDGDEARSYLPEGSAYEKYREPENTYTVSKPVFPSVGNAIITVKDSNKKILGYFTVPAKNHKEYINETTKAEYVNGEWQNENDLVKANNQAILVTEDEVKNSVGTITANGNRVTVNSEKTGITALKATIKFNDKYSEEINLLNDTYYASVQWAPLPSATVSENEDFYALTGQTITVNAQLMDSAGNPVAKADTPITFSVDGEPISAGTVGAGNLVEVTELSTETDEKGCAKLVVQATDVQAVLTSLTATATGSKYDVVLKIGDKNVNEATLRWVTPGLSFTPAVGADDDVINTLGETATVDEDYASKWLTKDAGTSWRLGYEVSGDTQDDKNIERTVTAITGLDIELTKDGGAEMKEVANGVATLSSSKTGTTKLTGTIDEDSWSKDNEVVFTVKTKETGKDASYEDHKSVGEGTPFFEDEVSLELPVVFGTVGTNLSVVSPKGNRIAADETTVYVKVTDSLNNAIPADKLDAVKVTINYTGKDASTGKTTTKSVDVTISEDDIKDGLVSVEVGGAVDGLTSVTKATIKAEYDNQTATGTVSFVDDKADFLLLNATYESTSKKVTLEFNDKVNKDTLKADMISIMPEDGGNPLAIKDVTADGKKVIVTLEEDISSKDAFTVEIVSDVEVEGIPYSLCDANGNELAYATARLTRTPAKLAATYDKDTDSIEFEINNAVVDADDQTILLVWDDAYVSSVDEDFESTVAAIESGTKVNCYYNGASTSVEIGTSAEEEKIADAQAKLDDFVADKEKVETGVSYITTLNKRYNYASGYVHLSQAGVSGSIYENYNVTDVEIEKDSKIFADKVDECVVTKNGDNWNITAGEDGNYELKLADNWRMVEDETKETVSVTYTHKDYPEVNVTMVYNVKVSTDESKKVLIFSVAE